MAHYTCELTDDNCCVVLLLA